MLAGKTEHRCLFCARVFEDDLVGTVYHIFDEAPKTKSICPLCKARIKKEAEGNQRIPKAM